MNAAKAAMTPIEYMLFRVESEDSTLFFEKI